MLFPFWQDVGVRSMLIAVTLFAVVNASVKFLDHIPFFEIVFFRALITLLICGFLLKKKDIPLSGNNKKILLARGLAGTLALTGFFYTLQEMPLATAVTLQYLSPIFTILLAGLLVKEPARPIQWFLFLTAFIGVYLVKGFDPRVATLDIVIGIAAAVSSALAYNFVRILRNSDHELVVVFYFPLVTLPLIGPFAFAHWVTPQGWDWFFLLLIGGFTQMAQVYMTRGYQAAKASKVGIINYLGVLYALGIGWFVFAESLYLWTMVGIGLIVVSVGAALRVRE